MDIANRHWLKAGDCAMWGGDANRISIRREMLEKPWEHVNCRVLMSCLSSLCAILVGQPQGWRCTWRRSRRVDCMQKDGNRIRPQCGGSLQFPLVSTLPPDPVYNRVALASQEPKEMGELSSIQIC